MSTQKEIFEMIGLRLEKKISAKEFKNYMKNEKEKKEWQEIADLFNYTPASRWERLKEGLIKISHERLGIPYKN